MNKNIATTPSLSFKEALCKAWSNLTNLKGRSRRSEFWWFMLVFYIALQIVSAILGMFLPELTSTVIESVLMGFAFAVTVRRLQDGGHSMLWVAVSWVASLALNVSLFASDEWTTFQATANPEDMVAVFTLPQVVLLGTVTTITGLVTIVFCCMDGTPGPNKYGESPKYAVKQDPASEATQTI